MARLISLGPAGGDFFRGSIHFAIDRLKAALLR
jgi:hypothetical protein